MIVLPHAEHNLHVAAFVFLLHLSFLRFLVGVCVSAKIYRYVCLSPPPFFTDSFLYFFLSFFLSSFLSLILSFFLPLSPSLPPSLPPSLCLPPSLPPSLSPSLSLSLSSLSPSLSLQTEARRAEARRDARRLQQPAGERAQRRERAARHRPVLHLLRQGQGRARRHGRARWVSSVLVAKCPQGTRKLALFC